MSALDYILLNDPSDVEINQKEIPEGAHSVVRRTEHVRTAGDFEGVPIQLIVDSSSAKKQPALPRRSTRSTASPNVASHSSDPISVDSGDEDDANVIAFVIGVTPVKKEVPEAPSGAGDVPDQQISVVLKKLNESKKISAVLKKLNESKRVVPERSVQVIDEVKKSKIMLKKKVKGSASKAVSPGGGVSVGGVEEAASSVMVEEKKKEKVEEKVEVVLKEKPEAIKGKGPVKANFHVFVPQWNICISDTTASSEICHAMLRNMATPAEKETLSKLSDEDSAYRVITEAARLVTSLPDCIERWAAAASRNDEVTAALKKKEVELKTSQEDLAAFQV
ncbi:hypothetical protein HanRHA438_Chr09g0377431 [Helianthus annuus]|nr:hypothetical protein HanHA89_Chr09g0321051 [Helianthus annuus]KAJ0886271.1 hypothetical protein HanRHA438_Chr09g0377431 [Helianthus annuus]